MKRFKSILILLCGILLLVSLTACEEASIEEAREYDFVIASGGGYNIVAQDKV